MTSNLFLQVAVAGCFVVLVVFLFFEKRDYLTYSVFVTILAAVLTMVFIEDTPLEDFILAIEWEVVFFLISISPSWRS